MMYCGNCPYRNRWTGECRVHAEYDPDECLACYDSNDVPDEDNTMEESNHDE